ncbi:MAG: hydroxyacid dehydrogenase [Chloroflexi bacterium]|nr:hydroxyacid dehydrogenase [Chloroflexota bacterium]
MTSQEEITVPEVPGPTARVLTYTNLGESARSVLAPYAEIITGPVEDTAGWYAEAATYDGMIINGQVFITGEVMDRIGPRLKVIGRTGIGVERINLAEATERGIMVVNTPDGPTESTAEHAIALMLALTKGVVFSDRITHSGQGFSPLGTLPRGLEAAGAVLGLVGLGRIGTRVAFIARALGMRVIAYDPFVSAERASELNVELAPDLATVLGEAQVVSIHCPAIPETFHLINRITLNLMRPGTLLVNVSRGTLVDEGALLEALDSGHLAGAALDVYDPEPPDPANPLLTHPKTICTSHIGSYTEAGVLRMQVMACQEVAAALQGKRPPNLVNREVWGKQRQGFTGR